MSRKSKEKDPEGIEEVDELIEVAPELPKVKKIKAPSFLNSVKGKAPSKESFHQWAAKRKIKPHHIPGLKAFVKDVDTLRTTEEWDNVFANY